MTVLEFSLWITEEKIFGCTFVHLDIFYTLGVASQFMVNDSSAPATKADLQYFAQGLLKQMDMLHEEISSLWREFPASEARMVHQFHVIAEQIHHDAIGDNHDEVEVVKDRVARLERHTGLVKA